MSISFCLDGICEICFFQFVTVFSSESKRSKLLIFSFKNIIFSLLKHFGRNKIQFLKSILRFNPNLKLSSFKWISWQIFLCLGLTLRICLVADCGRFNCQTMEKFERAKSLAKCCKPAIRYMRC
jgi:hypothetical protein